MDISHIPDELRLSIHRCFGLLLTQGGNSNSFLYRNLPPAEASLVFLKFIFLRMYPMFMSFILKNVPQPQSNIYRPKLQVHLGQMDEEI